MILRDLSGEEFMFFVFLLFLLIVICLAIDAIVGVRHYVIKKYNKFKRR